MMVIVHLMIIRIIITTIIMIVFHIYTGKFVQYVKLLLSIKDLHGKLVNGIRQTVDYFQLSDNDIARFLGTADWSS